LKILRTAAINLFRELGLKKADVWDNARLAEKLSKLEDMVDSDTTLVECQDDLVSVLASIRAKQTITVLDAIETSEAIEPEKVVDVFTGQAVEKGELPVGPTAEETAEQINEELKAENAKARKGRPPIVEDPEEGERRRAKAQAEKEAAAIRAGRPIGVRVSKTTPWYCGAVIAEFGIQAGVTPEMVKRMDELRGKNNPDEARAALNYTWHAINGFTKQVEI
jgi:hypothetical protein